MQVKWKCTRVATHGFESREFRCKYPFSSNNCFHANSKKVCFLSVKKKLWGLWNMLFIKMYSIKYPNVHSNLNFEYKWAHSMCVVLVQTDLLHSDGRHVARAHIHPSAVHLGWVCLVVDDQPETRMRSRRKIVVLGCDRALLLWAKLCAWNASQGLQSIRDRLNESYQLIIDYVWRVDSIEYFRSHLHL